MSLPRLFRAALVALPILAIPGPAAALVADHRSVDGEDSIPREWLDRARLLTVSFGHQSVGDNILDGLRRLAQRDPSRYAVAIEEDPGTAWFAKRPGIGHYRIGRNGNPASKIEDFARRVSLHGGAVSIAMMKLCYVDIEGSNRKAGPAQIFALYRDAIEALERRHPTVRFVWWTQPITRRGDGARDEFNRLVREYAVARGKPLFDIADIESHEPDGKPAVDNPFGERLHDGYTEDGGHLNAEGRLRAARAWWWLVARLGGWDGSREPHAAPSMARSSSTATYLTERR